MGIVYLCTLIEAVIGLMSACFPTMWPLIKSLVGGKGSTKYGYPSNSNNSRPRRRLEEDQIELSKCDDSMHFEEQSETSVAKRSDLDSVV